MTDTTQTASTLLAETLTRALVEPTAARFWVKVKVGAAAECWEWTAYRCAQGYGKFRLSHSRRLAMAHRVSLALSGVDVPAAMDVCHRCDNPPCVNPAHLFVGSPVDNMLDMWRKGRRTTRLTDSAVREIRAAGVAKEATHEVIARRHGVSKTLVSLIVNGHRRSHA